MPPLKKGSPQNRNVERSNTLTLVLACFFILLSGSGWHQEAASAATEGTPEQESVGKELGASAETKVQVTYYHTTSRCPTCRRLEEYSRETVERGFTGEIAEGTVLFRTINVDKPENKHFLNDYKLYTKSLIVSQTQNGKEVRWKNLPDIWKHVHNRERFEEYVKGEIEAYLKGP
jgi:hypothetical protein